MHTIKKLVLPTPFKVGPVNVYIIIGDAVTLVDTGPRDMNTWKALQQEIDAVGMRIQDIDNLVLTHFHPDHVGLVEEIKNIKDIPVYGHPQSSPYLAREQSFMQSREQFFKHIYELHGVPVELFQKAKETENYLRKYDVPVTLDHVLQEGDRLPGNEQWEVIETPGHSPDHISLYHLSSTTLLGGDHIIKHISSNAFIEPVYGAVERPRSLVVYQEALKKLLQYSIGIVYSGHGDEVYDVHTLIQHRIAKQNERAMQLYEMLEPNVTSFMLSKKLFPHLYLRELPLTMSEIIGHIDLLVEQGKLHVQKEGNRLIYRKEYTDYS